MALWTSVVCVVCVLVFVRPGHLSKVIYGCPARSLIKPCSCHDITIGISIVCEGVQVQALREVFENVAQTGQTLVYLKMKNNYMQQFPSFLLNQVDVRHLMAHRCRIAHVESSAFAGLENKIESIDFSENNFTQIPSESLKGLSSLVSLNLNYNQIESIHANAFQGLVSLLRLSLYGNKIVQIHPEALVELAFNLTRINLGGNELSSVPSEAFRVLREVQRIQLHENRIGSLQSDDFVNLQSSDKLDVLNLAHNLLTSIQANTFVDLKSLTSLDFESNQISSLDLNAFNGLQDSLQWLKLGENQLRRVPSESLQHLRKLHELDLRGNLIESINRTSFHKFGVNIKFLYLQQNQISALSQGTFDPLVSLEWLYLHENRLQHVPFSLFNHVMSNLTILDLHDNPLRCTCELSWYHSWSENNRKKQMMHVSRDIECELQDSGTRLSLHELNNHLKCYAFDASPNPLTLVSLLILVKLAVVHLLV